MEAESVEAMGEERRAASEDDRSQVNGQGEAVSAGASATDERPDLVDEQARAGTAESEPARDEQRPGDSDQPCDSASSVLRRRVTRQSEEAIGKLAQGVMEHPVVTGAVSAAFDARARALRAQEAAMGALNLPSASDLERLTRRIRNVSQRMEAVEEGLDRLDERAREATASSVSARLERIEGALARIEATLGGASPKPGASNPWDA